MQNKTPARVHFLWGMLRLMSFLIFSYHYFVSIPWKESFT